MQRRVQRLALCWKRRFRRGESTRRSFHDQTRVGARLIQESASQPVDEADSFQLVQGNPSDEACLLFTSGSTGQPKAVVLTHRGIRCRLDWSAREYPMLAGEDVMLFQLATTTLGGTMLPLTGLLQGCAVFVAQPALVVDTLQLTHAICQHGVNTLIGMSMETDHGKAMSNMKTIYLTGEAYSDDLLHRVARASPTATLINLYGMTETTEDAMAHCYNRNDLSVKWDCLRTMRRQSLLRKTHRLDCNSCVKTKASENSVSRERACPRDIFLWTMK